LLSEDLFGHHILLHSLQVTQPTYPLPLYQFYHIFSFTEHNAWLYQLLFIHSWSSWWWAANLHETCRCLQFK
jgi:hypothetical protein